MTSIYVYRHRHDRDMTSAYTKRKRLQIQHNRFTAQFGQTSVIRTEVALPRNLYIFILFALQSNTEDGRGGREDAAVESRGKILRSLLLRGLGLEVPRLP